MNRTLSVAALLCLSLSFAACQRGVDGRRIEAARAGDWLTYGRTYDEQRFSPLAEINTRTIGKLGLAWWAQFDTDRGQEATPLIADGVLYTTTAWSKVYAFDARTGRLLWRFDPQIPGAKGFNACCDVVNRGVALWGGRVYVGTLDGRLIALDAKTGKVVWSVQTTDPAKPYTITGAPRAIKGRIVIGNGGAEYPVRGYVSAYDARIGKLDWRFYITPNPSGAADGAASDSVLGDKAQATWSEGAWKAAGGGGAPWDAISYDAKSDLVLIGTGNAGPWNDRIRTGAQGDNLFATSIVALRPQTGTYVWHYQTTVRDAWDYDAVQQIVTADLLIGGQSRRVAMQANKNGFFYVLDAAAGKLISAAKFVPADWAERIDLKSGRPVEAPNARYLGGESHPIPSSLGGHNWQPMAFNPKLGLMFIPAMTIRGAFADPDQFSFLPGAWNTGERRAPTGPAAAKSVAPPTGTPQAAPAAMGELVAWDPVAQQARWRVRTSQAWTSGVLATAGGLVFHAADHSFSAYDAPTGRRLWTYDTGASSVAAASTYEISDVQYVALMVGNGGAGAKTSTEPRRKGRLLVFRLGGTASAPAFPGIPVPAPLDLATAEPSHGDPDRGSVRFGQLCGSCHTSGSFLPNLPRSPAILSAEGFRAIVLDGAKQSAGMASFRSYLNAAAVEDLRAYLLWSAKQPPMAVPASPTHSQ